MPVYDHSISERYDSLSRAMSADDVAQEIEYLINHPLKASALTMKRTK
jgi:hypothetical protein